MKIFVMVDMEGISGVCRSSQVSAGSPDYPAACRYMVEDVNACVEGCIQGGATKVVVRDCHCSGFNMPWDQFDPRGEYIQGGGSKERMANIASFDGLILLGYHAMAGTPQAILEHTMSSRGWQNFYMNGKRCGEVAIDAGIAGDHGVPTIMVSGDDKLCKESRKFIKGVVAVEVKKGLAVESGLLLPKERAHKLITDGAAKAVAQCSSIKPYKVKSPVRMRLECVSRGTVPQNRPGVKVIDGRTYEVTGATVEQALNSL